MKLYFNLVDICWKCRTHSIKTEMAVIKLIDSSIVPSDVLTEETKHFVERKIDLHFSQEALTGDTRFNYKKLCTMRSEISDSIPSIFGACLDKGIFSRFCTRATKQSRVICPQYARGNGPDPCKNHDRYLLKEKGPDLLICKNQIVSTRVETICLQQMEFMVKCIASYFET